MILINLLCCFFFSFPLFLSPYQITFAATFHLFFFFFWVVFVSVVFATGPQQKQTKPSQTKQNRTEHKNKLSRQTNCKKEKENHGFKLLVILATTKEKRGKPTLLFCFFLYSPPSPPIIIIIISFFSFFLFPLVMGICCCYLNSSRNSFFKHV